MLALGWQVPMAPALGLLLHECCYHSYNDQWASDGEEGRPRLRLADWASAVDEFKASGKQHSVLHLLNLMYFGATLACEAESAESSHPSCNIQHG